MASGSSSQSFLQVQTIENCQFFSPRYASISLIIAKEALGTFKAIVVRTERGDREAVLSGSGPSIQDALEAVHVKSAEAVQNYIATVGFAPVPNVKNRKSKRSGSRNDDNDSNTDSSVMTLEDCESLSDNETVSVASVGRAKKRSRRRANARHGRPRARSPTASSLRVRSRSITSSSSDSEPHYDPPIIPSRRPPVLSHLPMRPLQAYPSVFTRGPLPRQPQPPRPGPPGRLSPARYGGSMSIPTATGLTPVPAPPPVRHPAAAATTIPTASAAFTSTIDQPFPVSTATSPGPPTPPSINTPNGTSTTSIPTTSTPITINSNKPKTETHHIILHIRPRPHSGPERRALERVPGPLTVRAVKQAALACARRAQPQQQQQLQLRPGGAGFWAPRPLNAVVKAVVLEGVSYDLTGLAMGGDGDDGKGDLSGLMQVLRRPIPGAVVVPPPPRFEVEVWYGQGQAVEVAPAVVAGGVSGGGGVEEGSPAAGSAGQGMVFPEVPAESRGPVGQP